MTPTSELLLALGGILLLGLATDVLGQRTFLPRVTLMLLFGAVIGKAVLDVIPPVLTENFEPIAEMTLLMVGFLLGGRLEFAELRRSGRQLLWISIGAAVGATLVVSLGLWLVGVSLEIAILLGCIASATAPAATADTVMAEESESSFSRLLLSIVALDDAWGLILFSVGLAFVSLLSGTQNGAEPLLHAGVEIGGALLLGVVIGLPAAYLTGRIRKGQPMLVEALGVVFVSGGLADWLGVSFLITSMVVGAMVSNFAKHHERPFHEIENIEWPFLVVFFMLAGASLEFGALAGIGLMGGVYVVCRAIGKISGALAGGVMGGADAFTRRWTGIALLPQAGVALGMALIASNRFPEHAQVVLSVVVSTTVLFEVVGPALTRLVLRRAP
jgi:Kef-type K+ transport system membrane component KefB